MDFSIFVCYISLAKYEGVSKSFRPESITKHTLTTIYTRWKARQMVTAAKLTRLTHKIAIQLHLVAESCTICSSRSRRPVRKLLDTPSYMIIRFFFCRNYNILFQLLYKCDICKSQVTLPRNITRNLFMVAHSGNITHETWEAIKFLYDSLTP
jgi:hypothetical protein